MTLSTDIYVQRAIPARDVFEFVLAQLLEFDEDHRLRSLVVEDFTPSCFGTRLGQGLPAILSVDFKPGDVLRTAEQAAEHEDCDEDEPVCDGSGHDPACVLEVNLDTAYGYKGPNGMRCSDLHAVVIVRLGRWLAERSVPFAWRNEYTGEIHQGEEGIEELLSSGVEADRWFDGTLMPTIRRELGLGEGGSR